MAYKFNKIFKNVIANDIEHYSYIICMSILNCAYTKKVQTIIEKCNNFKGKEGLVFKNYSPNTTHVTF